MQSPPPPASFEEFWPYYVSQHRNKTCRQLHFVGTSIAMGCLAVSPLYPPAALAAPGLALAQSTTSVVISGYVKVAVGQISNSGATPTAAGVLPRAGLNSSEARLNDDGSRIAFTIRDQIDANLAGIAQIELRPTIDGNSGVNGGGSGAGFGSSTGNNYIGLESKDYGTLRLGALEQHFNQNT